MAQQLKGMVMVVGALVALVATVFSAYATGPGLMRVGRPSAGHGLPSADAVRQGCSAMRASDVVWVTLTEDGDIDEEVESYESGTNLITPVFEYDCVPRRVTVVTVFYLNGEAVYSDKETLKASRTKGLYSYPLSTTDGSPMDEGEWGVEFYNNKTLLTEGVVILGAGGADEGNTVTVEGTIKDKKTRKPIKGAVILALVPGVSIQNWLDGGQAEAEVFTAGKTDSQGIFTLEHPLERGQTYSLLVTARGYKPLGTDTFQIGDEDDDPVTLTIQMTK